MRWRPQPDFAELILAEQTYRVSGQAGRVGHGLYVTSAAPGSTTDEQLLASPGPSAWGPIWGPMCALLRSTRLV
jgi:hypothetical protein